MREISPEHLLSQLEDVVSLLLASPPVQNAWVEATRFPAEEIALQLYDAIDAFLGRLREHAVVDDADEASLRELRAYVESVQTKLFIDSDRFIDGWYVTEEPEWLRVRSLAEAALASLRRPTSDKGRSET